MEENLIPRFRRVKGIGSPGGKHVYESDRAPIRLSAVTVTLSSAKKNCDSVQLRLYTQHVFVVSLHTGKTSLLTRGLQNYKLKQTSRLVTCDLWCYSKKILKSQSNMAIENLLEMKKIKCNATFSWHYFTAHHHHLTVVTQYTL